MSSTTDNWALHSIVGAYLLALAPHMYYNIKMYRATKFQASNIAYGYFLFLPSPHTSIPSTIFRWHSTSTNANANCRPRENLDAWKKSLPKETQDQLARARGAHLNGLEGFPLFAAAMVKHNTYIHTKLFFCLPFSLCIVCI